MIRTYDQSPTVECLNREWVAANPGYSYEWARGMWFCGCDDCEAVR